MSGWFCLQGQSLKIKKPLDDDDRPDFEIRPSNGVGSIQVSYPRKMSVCGLCLNFGADYKVSV